MRKENSRKLWRIIMDIVNIYELEIEFVINEGSKSIDRELPILNFYLSYKTKNQPNPFIPPQVSG